MNPAPSASVVAKKAANRAKRLAAVAAVAAPVAMAAPVEEEEPADPALVAKFQADYARAEAKRLTKANAAKSAVIGAVVARVAKPAVNVTAKPAVNAVAVNVVDEEDESEDEEGVDAVDEANALPTPAIPSPAQFVGTVSALPPRQALERLTKPALVDRLIAADNGFVRVNQENVVLQARQALYDRILSVIVNPMAQRDILAKLDEVLARQRDILAKLDEVQARLDELVVDEEEEA